jgi:sortase (surface protein transpeptidase)
VSAALVAPTEVLEPVRPHVVAPQQPGRDGRERTQLQQVLFQVGLAVSLTLVLLVGFVVFLYGLSGLAEHRAQENLRKTFSHSLGQAIAPVGPATEGSPVAALDIPAIGLRTAIVVEGTSAGDLTNGPGHRGDTPLPGQYGVSVVYGRRVTYGAPFEHLMRLQVGDRITATTGQGTATYQVSSFGDGTHPAPANSANRLLLITADTAGIPHSFVSVSADLVSAPQAEAGNLPYVPESQKGLTTSTGSLLTTLLWSQALVVLVVLVMIGLHRWSRRATYLAAAPLVLGVLWNLYENVASLLPNLY